MAPYGSGWTDGWKDGRMDRRTYIQSDGQTYIPLPLAGYNNTSSELTQTSPCRCILQQISNFQSLLMFMIFMLSTFVQKEIHNYDIFYYG